MDIKCTQNIFKSSNGRSNVTYYILAPEGVDLRGVVQISHGMCEYFSRYTVFAKYLCSLGFIVCGNDHIGHGASAGRATELGFFAVRDGWSYLIQDMQKLTDIMQVRYPDLPYFVLGHSMGSLITRIYLTDYGKRLSGCILSGTAGPNPLARTGARMANSVAHSKGMTYRSSFLSNLAFKNYNRRIPDAHTMFDWLSRDDGVVQRFQSDAKCNFIFTAAGFRDLFTLVDRANTAKCFKSTPRDLPLLLISGDRDPVGGYGEGVRRVAKLYRAAGLTDLDVIFYKNGRHEILNETNRLDVYGDISRWLTRHLAQASDDAQETAKEEPHADSDP